MYYTYPRLIVQQRDTRINFAKTIKSAHGQAGTVSRHVPIDMGRTFTVTRHLPEKGITLRFPSVSHADAGKKVLNNCLEKEIGGVLYRVHSVFAGPGDFQALYEGLHKSRVLKHCRDYRAAPGAQPGTGRKEVLDYAGTKNL